MATKVYKYSTSSQEKPLPNQQKMSWQDQDHSDPQDKGNTQYKQDQDLEAERLSRQSIFTRLPAPTS